MVYSKLFVENCTRGCLENVKYLWIDHNESISFSDQHDGLKYAICNGHMHVVKYLLSQPTCKATTFIPLLAAFTGNLDLLEECVKFKSFSWFNCWLYACEGNQLVVVHYIWNLNDRTRGEILSGLSRACTAGSLSVMEFLIGQLTDANDKLTMNIDECFVDACIYGHAQAAQFLFKHVQSIHAYSRGLCGIARCGDFAEFSILMDLVGKNVSSLSLLFNSAVKGGNLDIINYILTIYTPTHDGWISAAVVAAQSGHMHVMQLILKHDNLADMDWSTCVSKASFINAELARFLFDKYKNTITMPISAFDGACMLGDVEFIEYVMTNLKNLSDHSLVTGFSHACGHGHYAAAKYLMKFDLPIGMCGRLVTECKTAELLKLLLERDLILVEHINIAHLSTVLDMGLTRPDVGKDLSGEKQSFVVGKDLSGEKQSFVVGKDLIAKREAKRQAIASTGLIDDLLAIVMQYVPH